MHIHTKHKFNKFVHIISIYITYAHVKAKYIHTELYISIYIL